MQITFRQWLLLGLATLPPLWASAQLPLREKQVPQEVRDDFALRFDGVESVRWFKQDDDFYEAQFYFQQHNFKVYYGQEARWELTDEEWDFRALPEKAQKYLVHAYPGCTPHDTRKVSSRRVGIIYEVRVNGTGVRRFVTFDMHGELLSNEEVEVIEATPDTVKAGPKLPGLFKKGDGR